MFGMEDEGRKLEVLEVAHALFLNVDDAAEKIRTPRHWEISRQLVKSSLSIGSNISEGREKEGQVEFLRFLNMALGSTGELLYQIRAGKDVRAIVLTEAEALHRDADRVKRMLRSLRWRVRQDLR
jgi:four helix bundle protein